MEADMLNYAIQCQEADKAKAIMIEEQFALLNSQGYDVQIVDDEIIATKKDKIK